MKQTFSLNSNFSLTHNDDGSTQLQGFAIHGGEDFIVNGIFEVPESEMKNCAKSLKGAKLMKDHDTFHVDSIIGRVNKTKQQFDENAEMMGVHYDASLVVDDTNLAKKIEEGLIDATSIGFSFEPECSICGNPYYSEECEHLLLWDDMHLVCRDMKCHELSLVTFGADPHASVTGSLDAKDIEALKEEFSKQKEEFIMSKEDNMVETLKSENLELSEKVSDLEAKLEQQEADFQKEKDTLENEYQGEVLTLQQEKKALDDKIKAMQQELSAFRAEAEAKLAKELETKKEQVMELAKKFGIEDLMDEERFNDADYLEDKLAMLKGVDATVNPEKETVPKFSKEQDAPHEVNEESKEHVPFARASRYFSFGTKAEGD